MTRLKNEPMDGGFVEEEWRKRPAGEFLDAFADSGIAAAGSALSDAGIAIANLDPDRVGIAVGTSLGGLGTLSRTCPFWTLRGVRSSARRAAAPKRSAQFA
jgi:3-oxoacyl-(acyl-carrier-protein) synthase